MSINLSEKSSESLSEENILASQITQNKSHKLTQTKEINVTSNNYSEKEDLLVNNLIMSSNIPKIEKNDNNENK